MFGILLAVLPDVVFAWLQVALVAVVYFEGSAVLFVSGSIAMHADCCCDEQPEPCDACDTDTTPLRFQVVLSGVTGVDPPAFLHCTTEECVLVDGTYILEQNPDENFECQWRFFGAFEICDGVELESLILTLFAGGFDRWQLGINTTHSGFNKLQKTGLTLPLDCGSVSGVVLTWDTQPGNPDCWLNDATATITAL